MNSQHTPFQIKKKHIFSPVAAMNTYFFDFQEKYPEAENIVSVMISPSTRTSVPKCFPRAPSSSRQKSHACVYSRWSHRNGKHEGQPSYLGNL